MTWIFQLIVRHRAISSLLLTVVLSLTMLNANAQRQARISRGLLISVFYPLGFTLSLSTNVRNIFAENKRLRAESAALMVRVAMLEQRAAENERLREILKISESFSYDLLPARVIMREPATPFRSVVIAAGRSKGVGLWMPVVDRRGVVGKVIQVLPGISLVQLLKDPAAHMSVMVARTRTPAILESGSGETFSFRCRSHTDVAPGDTITTSGLGGIFPSGLMVGFVRKVSDDPDPLFKRVVLDLSVDFEHMEEVFVMRLSPQWSAFRAEVDSIKFDK
jgi:rod shape-determining protein MreC